jgi:phage shock protein A
MDSDEYRHVLQAIRNLSENAYELTRQVEKLAERVDGLELEIVALKAREGERENDYVETIPWE